MKVVIVADIDIADDVNTCVIGYSSKDGWEEVEVTPRQLPEECDDATEIYNAHGEIDCYQLTDYARGWNACLDEIMGEIE